VRQSRRRVSALVLLGMIACVLADALLALEPLRYGARVLLIAYLALEWGRMANNARAMVALAAAMVAAAASTLAEPGRAVATSLDTGAFFATFFANQFFLREAARTSPLVHRCSTFFVNQTPGRRYALLTVGGYLFGIILNLGVLSLLGIMIIKRNSLAAAGGSLVVREVRERRMVLALLRGFSVTTLASPLSISLAVMLTALPSLHWTSMLPLGMATGALVLALGWLYDRLRAPNHLAHLVPPIEPKRDVAALLGITGLVLLVFFLAVAVETVAAIPLSRAMLVSTPLVGLGWLAIQHRRYGPELAARLVGRRIVHKAAETFPNYRSEIAILSSAGFIGTLFSTLVPPELLGTVVAAPWLPAALLPPLAAAAVIGPALVGVNPIVTVTILASALRTAPGLPVATEALALALMSGWCLSINSSALTASAMLLGELVGKPAETIVLRWNGWFTVLAYVAVSAWLVLLGLVIR
jgi:hypothetical protein